MIIGLGYVGLPLEIEFAKKKSILYDLKYLFKKKSNQIVLKLFFDN